MLIAKLRICLKDCSIAFNSSAELGTDKGRGTVLQDGKVVRGLGTHFASLEAKERYDRLTSRSNAIRTEFNNRFGRGPFDGTYIVNPGEGKAFAQKFESDKPDVDVSVFEYDIQGNPDAKELEEYCLRLKNQLKQVPLGRGQDADEEGLAALELLSKCPMFAKDTADSIQRMVSEVRVGKMNRTDLKRGISLLQVNMEAEVLMAPRGRPVSA